MDQEIAEAKSLLQQAIEKFESAQGNAEAEIDEMEEPQNSENADRVTELNQIIADLEEATTEISEVIEKLPK